MDSGALVEHFFRHEAGRLHAVLIRLVGISRLQLAEDVAQEAMLRALRTWAMGGVPPNPSAWITRVAKNLALDALRREQMQGRKADAVELHQTAESVARQEDKAVFAAGDGIGDDLLRLYFVCAHPELPPDAQVVLALKIIGGFSTAEIARAFLRTEAAVEKQLTRSKARIAAAGVPFELPEGADLAPRLEAVLAALYLIFNEGYKASSGEQLLREDLCREAIRLMERLVAHPVGDVAPAHALLALMLLNSARFSTRLGGAGELLRLDAQDRSKWDHAAIDRGLRHLRASAGGSGISAYHLQAAIAAQHCLATDLTSTDWPQIVRYYDHLLRLQPSPIVALNRAVAVAYASGPEAGLAALAAMPAADKLSEHHLRYAVEGELRKRLGQPQAADEAFRRAHSLAPTAPEKAFLAQHLDSGSSHII